MAFFNKRMILLFTNLFLLAGIGTTIANYSTSLVQGEAASSGLIIVEVYGGGGSTAVPYNQDYVMIYNQHSSSVNVNNWSFQYGSAAAGGTVASPTAWSSKVNFPDTSIGAYSYYLICLSTVAASGSNLPTCDLTASPSIAVSATDGKVAIVNSTTLLSGPNPSSNSSVIDFVGYGTANGFEGTVAVANVKTNSLGRKTPFNDTDNNFNDFQLITPTPLNSSNNGKTDAQNFASTFSTTTENKSTLCDASNLSWSTLTTSFSSLNRGAKTEFSINNDLQIKAARDRYLYLRNFNSLLENFANL